jgi:hypothetical protein
MSDSSSGQAEAEFHQRSFAFYLARLERSKQSQRTLADEDCCLHHWTRCSRCWARRCNGNRC